MTTERNSSGDVISTDGTRTVVTLPYSASITPNDDFGEIFRITVTNGVAFTVNAPTNPRPGRVIVFEVFNNSGGVMGAITWDAIYHLPAFVNPASTKRTSIQFYNTGSSWRILCAQSPEYA